MQRERVTEDIYVFTSDLYVQVTAGLIVTSDGAILIDTLMYPEETLQIKKFAEKKLDVPIEYVINTHFHADHTVGTCFFPEAKVISHYLCRELLDKRGRESLRHAQVNSRELLDVELVLPEITFHEKTRLRLGDKTVLLTWTPGHSADSIMCEIPEDQVLFASDTVLPVPYFVGGDFDQLVEALERLSLIQYENIVQGHGDVIMRGEVNAKIQDDIDYLYRLRDAVAKALMSSEPDRALGLIEIEACGKSRVLLGGVAELLHQKNVLVLADMLRERVHI